MDLPELTVRKLFNALDKEDLFETIVRGQYTVKLISRNTMAVYTHDANRTEIGEWFFRSEVIEDDPHQNTEIIQDEGDEEVQLDLF